jgi:alginate O-acetyltransferase complex protein AlgJ
MEKETKNKGFKLGDIKKLIFVVVFFCILIIPSIQMIKPIVEVGEVESFDEKRKLATWKDVDTKSADSFIATYERYYKDNFGFRDLFISLNNRWKVQQFKVSPIETVLIGSEGWYFITINNSVEDHTGKIKMKEEDLHSIRENLEYKRDYIESRGGKFYLVVLPDKMSVYSRYLPYLNQGEHPTRFDQILKYCSGSGLEIVDMRSELQARSERELVYQKTDSHWNKNGGFVAYQIIMERLKKDYPELNAYSRDQFNTAKEGTRTGDLTTIVGVEAYEENVRFFYETKPNVYRGKVELLEKFQDYNVSYKATFSFLNPTLQEPKLMVINDSYINYVYPFLGNHFSESHYFWSHDFREELVDEIDPDIFIQLIVERSLPGIVALDK